MTNSRLEQIKAAIKFQEVFETDKWIKEIPHLNFKEDWNVKIIPPFGGAVSRFLVTKEGKKGYVSIYLDCYSILGGCDMPYWEVYPYDDDVFRCPMNDTKALMDAIEHCLNQLQ
jgi:hypothetical protein